ncbi:MAG: Membrane dipeptidase [Ramlibacter sp.]|nr:Membrane dipeptidase [Ramlibacter sp.]
MDTALTRRQFAALAAASAMPQLARAQPARQPFIADMHSHYGMFLPRFGTMDLAREMRDNGLVLLAWAIVDDRPWISTRGPLRQVSEPRPGEIWAKWQVLASEYEAKLAHWKLAKVLTVADVDAALAGEPRVLLACESANFLEGDPQRLALAHARGVRHLQLVHYIDGPLGDHQTAPARHDGLTAVGTQVVAECARLGIVVDLAHGTGSLVDAALAASDRPPVWSHSWITPQGGGPQDANYLARSLALPQARKIAARGGVIGLWCLRSSFGPAYPVNSKGTYADEILRMCDLVGPDHVGFGTDMEGVWPNRMMNDYGDLRDVVENLLKRGVDAGVLQKVFSGNYARVLKQCLPGLPR